jgi:ribonuclease III
MHNGKMTSAGSPLREAARRFEEASGLRFEDKTLLQRALTHRSYINESREFLIMGRGEDDMGGRQRPAILCGAFEALIGALYLDQGFIAVKRFMMSLVDPILPELVRWIEKKDAKSRLQELCQAHLHTTPQYRTATTEGPDHARLFTMHVLIDGEVWGTGQGPSKRIASQEAAASAIIRLESLTT